MIEHVGGWSDMLRMANEVRRVAHRYAVQTPYFWFPIEPHMRSPLMHWLPESISYRIVMSRKCGFYDKQDSVLGAMSVIRDAHLLDVGQMQALFPDADDQQGAFPRPGEVADRHPSLAAAFLPVQRLDGDVPLTPTRPISAAKPMALWAKPAEAQSRYGKTGNGRHACRILALPSP